MTAHPDLEPAARRMADLVVAVPDEALTRPTPCERHTVGDLLDHIGGSTPAFTAAAAKKPLEDGPSGNASRLDPDGRTRIPRDLEALGEAWRNPEAWAGMTAAGDVDLPGAVAGMVALDELVIHGWDLAQATGQSVEYENAELEAVYAMVQALPVGRRRGPLRTARAGARRRPAA